MKTATSSSLPSRIKTALVETRGHSLFQGLTESRTHTALLLAEADVDQLRQALMTLASLRRAVRLATAGR